MVNWLNLTAKVLTETINRLPIERLITRPPDTRKRLEELQEIIGGAKQQKDSPQPEHQEETHREEPHHKVHITPQEGDLSTEETVAYQNREIGKLLMRMEGHCTQKFRLFGKICDCGAQKHLLDLESLLEETIPMVDNPDVYYELIDLGRELGPKCLPEAVATLKYDTEFPSYARRYRDLRKKLIGRIDATEMERPETNQILPEEEEADD